ncbi:MAG TPA: hypothetical protein VE262_15815 [Blastocatellia bacterium]|nr:hypothetical protein [Blastocatellia bacterium]
MSKKSNEDLVNGIVQLWADSFPSSAYASGFGGNKYAGKLIIPTEEWLEGQRGLISQLRSGASQVKDDELRSCAEKVLGCIEETFYSDIPGEFVADCALALWYLLLKKEYDPSTLKAFLGDVKKSLAHEMDLWADKKVSVQMRRVCIDYARFLGSNISSLESLPVAVRSAELRAECRSVKAKIDEFISSFCVDGMLVDGILTDDTSHLLALFEKHDEPPSPTPRYHEQMKHLFDLPFSPEEIKERALLMLRTELDLVSGLTREIAKGLGLTDSCSLQHAYEKIGEKFPVGDDDLVKAKAMMDAANAYLLDFIQEARPEDDPPLKEADQHLKRIITSAGTSFYNLLSGNPTAEIYINPDRNHSLLTLLNVLVHEYAHAYQITRADVVKKSQLLLIPTTLMIPVFEAVAFHREWEFYEAAASLLDREELSDSQSGYLNLFTRLQQGKKIDKKLGVKAFELETRVWIIIRLLRAIFDVDINLGNKSYMEFINWASGYTGLSKEFVHNECYAFLLQPGYAPAYVFCGIEYKELQDRMQSNGVSRKTFNTFACDMGFWPWTLAIARMEQAS